MKHKTGKQADKETDKGGCKKCVPASTVYSMFQEQQAVSAMKDARDQYNRMCRTDTDWITSRNMLDVRRSLLI